MKNYKLHYGEIKLSLAINFYAENKKDFIEKLKQKFKQDYNLELKDNEIYKVCEGI